LGAGFLGVGFLGVGLLGAADAERFAVARRLLTILPAFGVPAFGAPAFGAPAFGVFVLAVRAADFDVDVFAEVGVSTIRSCSRTTALRDCWLA
jgi:hypothetical protein